MKPFTKHYSNGEVTILWKPNLCAHTGICINGLPKVFDKDRRPWIIPESASTEELIRQVDQCPSGALSYIMNRHEPEKTPSLPEVRVEVKPKGPLLVMGRFLLVDVQGKEMESSGNMAFCRCGMTKNDPFCDGSHSGGTEKSK